MRELWQSVDTDPDVAKIFALQNEDGSWFSGGPWGPRGYSRKGGYTATRPKFVTTAWILPFLGEIGYRTDDERIKKGADFILPTLSEREDNPSLENCCGLAAIPLWGLASVGLTDDERLTREWTKLLNCQRGDGGWLNPNHLADSPTPSKTKGRWPWDKSCAWGSYYALRALDAARREADTLSFIAASKFLYTHLAKQNPDQLRTWVYHGHNLVRELEIFCDTGIDMESSTIQTILDWLRGYYRSDEGVFRAQEKPIPDYPRQVSKISQDLETERGAEYWPLVAKVSHQVLRYSLYHLVEDDWLTYRLTNLAARLN